MQGVQYMSTTLNGYLTEESLQAADGCLVGSGIKKIVFTYTSQQFIFGNDRQMGQVLVRQDFFSELHGIFQSEGCDAGR
jgi:hypothetical protein